MEISLLIHSHGRGHPPVCRVWFGHLKGHVGLPWF